MGEKMAGWEDEAVFDGLPEGVNLGEPGLEDDFVGVDEWWMRWTDLKNSSSSETVSLAGCSERRSRKSDPRQQNLMSMAIDSTFLS